MLAYAPDMAYAPDHGLRRLPPHMAYHVGIQIMIE